MSVRFCARPFIAATLAVGLAASTMTVLSTGVGTDHLRPVSAGAMACQVGGNLVTDGGFESPPVSWESNTDEDRFDYALTSWSGSAIVSNSAVYASLYPDTLVAEGNQFVNRTFDISQEIPVSGLAGATLLLTYGSYTPDPARAFFGGQEVVTIPLTGDPRYRTAQVVVPSNTTAASLPLRFTTGVADGSVDQASLTVQACPSMSARPSVSAVPVASQATGVRPPRSPRPGATVQPPPSPEPPRASRSPRPVR